MSIKHYFANLRISRIMNKVLTYRIMFVLIIFFGILKKQHGNLLISYGSFQNTVNKKLLNFSKLAFIQQSAVQPRILILKLIFVFHQIHGVPHTQRKINFNIILSFHVKLKASSNIFFVKNVMKAKFNELESLTIFLGSLAQILNHQFKITKKNRFFLVYYLKLY